MAIAELLRSARERRGVTLDRLAEETKIPRGRLAAFENEGFRPDGDFYQRAQIRACARALSLDERSVLEELNHDLAPTVADASSAALESQVSGPQRPYAVLTTFVIVAVVIASTALLIRGSNPEHLTESPVAQAAGNRADAEIKPVHEEPPEKIVEPATRATVGTAEADETLVAVAVPAVTELLVTSRPEGARVTVDGVGWGVTPLTIRHLPEGRKRIRLTRDGYVAAERVMYVQPGGASKVVVELEPDPPPVGPQP